MKILGEKARAAAVKIALKAAKAKELLKGERGSLDQMTWVIGAAVVVVLIIVVFMVLAPNTARNMWNSFVDYAQGQFGF